MIKQVDNLGVMSSIHRWVVCSFFLFRIVVMAADGSLCTGKLTKYRFPVVVTHLSEIYHLDISKLSAFSFKNDTWTEIPIQLDERNLSNNFVLDQGLPYTKNSDDWIVDQNDEMVLNGADFGEDFYLSQISPAILEKSRKLWKLSYCSRFYHFGSILLIYREKLFRVRSFSPVVHYVSREKIITTPYYEYKFTRGNPILMGEVQLKTASGFRKVINSGYLQVNLRYPLLLGWIKWITGHVITSDQLESVIESWQTGPIRTIIAIGVKIKDIFPFMDLHLFSEIIFYQNFLQIPTKIKMPVNFSTFFAPGTGVIYTIRFPKKHIWKVTSNIKTLPMISPEELVGAGRHLEDEKLFYVKGSHDKSNFLFKVRVTLPAHEKLLPPYLIVKDMFRRQIWENQWPWLGQLDGDFGLYIDFSMMTHHQYEFALDLYLSPDAIIRVETVGTGKVHWKNYSQDDKSIITGTYKR